MGPKILVSKKIICPILTCSVQNSPNLSKHLGSITALLLKTFCIKLLNINSIKNAWICARCTYRIVASMDNQDWSHRHATWEVNAFLMLPTGCCRSYNTQSARLHQQLNAFLMSTLPTMVQFVTLPQYPKWWKPDCTSLQSLRKCTRTS